jgi:hypothetical protein
LKTPLAKTTPPAVSDKMMGRKFFGVLYSPVHTNSPDTISS